MEICKSNVWGTVCHTLWTLTDARVVCRQLGYSVAGNNISFYHPTQTILCFLGPVATTSASFGQGSGPIVLNSVQCSGSERRLGDCPSGVVTRCSHAHDAGVRCQAVQTGIFIIKKARCYCYNYFYA